MRATILMTLLVFGMAAAGAEPQKCHTCGKAIEGNFYRTKDRVRGNIVDICGKCGALEARCFACALPVPPDGPKLADGRHLCPADDALAIRDEDEAKRISLEARDVLDRLYWSLLEFPSTNVVLNIVDRFTLEGLFKSPGYGQRCPSVFGATRSGDAGDDRWIHSISILSGLTKLRLETVAAHEFGHAWLNENLRSDRRAALSADAIEAFCELIAYDLALQRGDENEKKVIKENPYTRGQLDAFIMAKEQYGMGAIVDWMKSGEAEKLDAADPRSVHFLREARKTPVVAASLNFANSKPVKVPEILALTAITGTASRRFAIINDRTFGASESARVRLATTNLLVKCLEIRSNSVLVEVGEKGVKQELFLPKR